MTEKELLDKVYRSIKDTCKNKNILFKTGFDDLDEIINIPQDTGAVITIAGRPAMGKSSMMLSIMENILSIGKKCLFLSLEFNSERIIQRLLSMGTEISSVKILSGNLTPDDLSKIEKQIDVLMNWDLVIDDTTGITTDEIEKKISKVKPDVVFIDYLQLIHSEKKQDRNFQIESILGDLKRISKENNILIFMSSQLSRGLESRLDKRPLLSDLRDSSSIETLSDVVIFIYRPEYYKKEVEDIYLKGESEIIIAKNHFGPCATVIMCFKPQFMKFYSGRSTISDLF